MKKLLIALLITVVSLLTAPCLLGWVITRSAHAPRPGDSPAIDLYQGVDPGAPGPARLWDFSAALPKGDPYGLRITGIPDSLVTMRFPRHRMYCSLKGDSLLWHGYETRHILLTDSAGIPYMTYPVAYGDSCARPFCLTGRYALERPAANRGLACVKADASGTLLMPDGDTVRSVLRVCREYRGVPRLGPGALRLAAVDSALSPEVVYREYDWYAPGYRYPLFSLRQALALVDGAEVEYGESYSYACTRHSQQADIKDDPENEKVRETLAAADPDALAADPDADPGRDSPCRDIQVSVSGSLLTLEFDYTGTSLFLELTVSDSAGIPYVTIPRRPVVPGHNTLTLDLGRLPQGEYALLLIDGSARVSRTFTCR